MQTKIVVIVAALLVPLSGTWLYLSHEDPASKACRLEEDQLGAILTNDPSRAAKEAIAAGNLNYLEVFGFSATIPGIHDSTCVYRNNLNTPVPGTSDALCSRKQAQQQAPAKLFAREYNSVVAAARREKSLPTCAE